jgi:hypothetical protein
MSQRMAAISSQNGIQSNSLGSLGFVAAGAAHNSTNSLQAQ